MYVVIRLPQPLWTSEPTVLCLQHSFSEQHYCGSCSTGAAYTIALNDGQNSSDGTLNLANQTPGISDTL